MGTKLEHETRTFDHRMMLEELMDLFSCQSFDKGGKWKRGRQGRTLQVRGYTEVTVSHSITIANWEYKRYF